MGTKLQKLLEEIKSGERTTTSGIDISLEEYLSKDADGITFLEHLLKNNFCINILDENKFAKSVEIAYLYCKYNHSLFSFELEEEDLFSTFNGKRLIDYIVDNNKLSSSIIKSVKDHIEIVDMVISTNIYMCDFLSEEIIEKLMIPDSNGVYPIEKYFNDERVVKILISLVNHPKELIELCKKYNKYNLLREVNEKNLMYEINENYTLLDDLCSKNILPTMLEFVPKNIDFVNYLRKKNLYKYLKSAKEEVLLLEIESGKTLLEDLIEKGYIPELENCLYQEKTILILYQKNKLELIKNVYNKILLTPIKEIFNNKSLGDELLLEYLLNQGYNPLSSAYDNHIIKILYNKGYYEILGKKLNEKKLFMEIEEGTPIIDKLLENNIDVYVSNFKSIAMAKKLYEAKRIDLLVNGNLDILLSLESQNDTYFDHILNSIKNKNIKYNLDDFSFYGCPVNTIAKFYLTIAKHDMMEYIEKLDEDDLLEEYNGKTLLDELLDLDSQLTISKVISNDVKSKIKIAIILKARGLEQKNIDVPLENSTFSQGYLDSVEKKLGIGPLPAEGELLLKKLYELFANDGKSDISLVSSLISGYRHSLIINYDVNIQELRNLIQVKERNLEKFIYIKEEEKAYFSRANGSVHCDNTVTETILHETGHALHSYLANNDEPEQYEAVVERARSNPETLKKVEAYVNKFISIKEEIESIVKEKYKEFFDLYFNDKKIKEIEALLNKSRIEKRFEFKSLGIPSQTLDIILDNSFTVDEYIEHQKRIFLKEYIDVMLRSEFSAFIAIGDILDAIYEGELHSKTLKNENGEKIDGTYGHGISYYCNTHHGFDEMVANFASISKSKDSSDILNLLRSIVGDELYNMLSEFYYNNIVVSKEIEEIKTL